MRNILSSFRSARVIRTTLTLIAIVTAGGLAVVLTLRPAADAATKDQTPIDVHTDGAVADADTSAPGADAAEPPRHAASEADPLVHQATIELDDGQLDVGEVLAQLAEQSGLDGQAVRANVNWTIDVKSPAGQLTLSGMQRFTRGVVTFDLYDDRLELTFDRLKLRNEEKRIRRSVLMFFKRLAPEAAARMEARYGFVVHRPDGSTVSPSIENLDSHVVVLVHGLDDPGKVWSVLAPTLVDEGYTVCEFFYPNDQAIDQSADLFVEHLETLHQLGVRRISIVAHSMGGLVSRWTLTGDSGYGGRVQDQPHLPDVQRLILVGTPNHGSKMARFRLAAEIREQVERLLSGDGMLFGSVFDGTGEAKIDLLPDSAFLTTLNRRPHPADLPITIIAGNTSPVTPAQLERLKPVLAERMGPQASRPAGDLIDSLADVSEGLGDGLVSLESARLEGVEDFVIVAGNHLTMIRNYSQASDRVPPAVPIILERLKAEPSTAE